MAQLDGNQFEGYLETDRIDVNAMAGNSRPYTPTNEKDMELFRIAQQEIMGNAPQHPGQPQHNQPGRQPVQMPPSYKLLRIGTDEFRVNLRDGTLEKKVTVPMSQAELEDLYIVAPNAKNQKCATEMSKFAFLKRVWQKIDQ